MDASLMSFTENFSANYPHSDFIDSGTDDSSMEGVNNNFPNNLNDWEMETENNGDMALIPMSSQFCGTIQDFSSLVNTELFHGLDECPPLVNLDRIDVEDKDEIDTAIKEVLDINNFDLPTYINDSKPIEIIAAPRTIKACCKKIDMDAKQYIVDEIDVETVEDDNNTAPVLEADDMFSLLEQFETASNPNKNFDDLINDTEMSLVRLYNNPPTDFIKLENVFEMGDDAVDNCSNQMEEKPQETVSSMDIKVEDELTSEVEIKNEPVECSNIVFATSLVKQEQIDPALTAANANSKPSKMNGVKNKQHLVDSIPKSLITRINNESGKQKKVTVIPPIVPNTNRKRGQRIQEQKEQEQARKMMKLDGDNNRRNQLPDHTYCRTFINNNCDEKEELNPQFINKQPMVKTADGKLMVSLLKVNTIHKSVEKKKLNLEEYKKRRLLKMSSSNSNSPATSTSCSPVPEDDTTKLQKHQEKMTKMAAELLNAVPQKAVKHKNGTIVENKPKKDGKMNEVNNPLPIVEEMRKVEVTAPKLPEDIEVKTFVSIGINTDFENGFEFVEACAHLEDIKPLLKKAESKINSNSFITSIAETIPKSSRKMKSSGSSNNVIQVKQQVVDGVREDLVIQYLNKNRKPPKTKNADVQTTISLIGEYKENYNRCRSRERSSSSHSSTSSRSNSPHYSRSRTVSKKSHSYTSSRRSSTSSDSSRSTFHSSPHSRTRSRSRSVSPNHQRPKREYLLDVEERRVVYVGRISRGTTRDDLRRRFSMFGHITNVSLHFREKGDNYGFVTFLNKEDAFDAIERGNDYGPPEYDLSFGGRRIFCRTSYSDLDNVREEPSYYKSHPDHSFDVLLERVQKIIRKRKT